MIGFNPSLHRTRRSCCPLEQVTQESGSLVLPDFFTPHDTTTFATAGELLVQVPKTDQMTLPVEVLKAFRFPEDCRYTTPLAIARLPPSQDVL